MEKEALMLSINQSFYPSDLTNQQWQIITNLIPPAKLGGRPRATDIRKVINAIFYVCRTGCAWRYLPLDFPAWQTVYGYFCTWQKQGVWQRILVFLNQLLRIKQQRNIFPTTVIIDAQSIRAPKGELRGWDGFKKVRGRKRQILVDTLGLIWSAGVHEANRSENNKAYCVINHWPQGVPHPKKLLGDAGYEKNPFRYFINNVWDIWPEIRKGTQKEVVRGKKGEKGLAVDVSNLKPQRWIVERCFAWFNYFRRLSKDYERKTINSEAFIYISAVELVLTALQEVK